MQNELQSFGLIAKFCLEIWVLGIKVFRIIVDNIRDLHTIHGREGETGTAVDVENFRVSRRVA